MSGTEDDLRETMARYGVGRVVRPSGAMPQGAERLDPSLPIGEFEILIEVDTLNIDSASFRQIVEDVGADEEAVGARVRAIVAERGKMQNPVTGSGGMLLGTVVERGRRYDTHPSLTPGARVATLVSLTLTPLHIDHIRAVRLGSDQVLVDGHAILPTSAPIVAMPDDLEEPLALACLDVCGAPAQVRRLVSPGMRVLILGAGKSGALSMAAARRAAGTGGRVVALDRDVGLLEAALDAGVVDAIGACDATDPLAVVRTARDLLGGEADVVVNTVNAPHTEMSSILCARDGGTVYFFNMATSFSRAALGAEGVGKDVNLIIGNGFVPGHAELALDLLRSVPFVRATFARAAGTS